MAETFLRYYIRQLAETAVDPSREGVAKGDPIGFSKVKYISTLMNLYNQSVKEAAEKCGVSYGVLRKWRTEEDYKAVLAENIRRFPEYAIRRIMDSYEDLAQKRSDAIANADLDDEENLKKLFDAWTGLQPLRADFRDVSQYSDELFESLLEKVIDLFEKHLSFEDYPAALNFFDIGRSLVFLRGDDSPSSGEIEKAQRSIGFALVRKAIEQPTEKNRVLGLLALDLMTPREDVPL